MTDHNAEAMQATFERDQNDAAIHDITKQVVRHFLMLQMTKMSEATALTLTRDFQRFLMGEPEIEYVFGEVD